ncbi:MAG: ATP-grasp domain-containing protein [Chitinophagaceae bacterium]
MNILFCSNPLDNKTVDFDYQDEFAAATQNSFTIHLFSFENLTEDKDAEFATRKIKKSETSKIIIYRGWMLKPNQYVLLYNALLNKNYQLINSPTEYQNCHYFPDSYRFISGHTPKSIWVTINNQQVNYDEVLSEIETFGNFPLIVKDFVKSQKHYWDTACFIPSATDKEKVKSVVGKFVELQNTDLNEGLVFREFADLSNLTIHSKSGMPLKQEYRLFFLNRQLLASYDYWEEGEYSVDDNPPFDLFKEIGQNIESNFFSMDIAKKKNGDWIIIELGDGQVAGLPDKVDSIQFYNLVRQNYGS